MTHDDIHIIIDGYSKHFFMWKQSFARTEPVVKPDPVGSCGGESFKKKNASISHLVHFCSFTLQRLLKDAGTELMLPRDRIH